jgi:hypothetical protein
MYSSLMVHRNNCDGLCECTIRNSENAIVSKGYAYKQQTDNHNKLEARKYSLRQALNLLAARTYNNNSERKEFRKKIWDAYNQQCRKKTSKT